MTLLSTYVFGANFTQDTNFIVISKSDYPDFSRFSNPSGQTILAILLKEWVRRYFGKLEDRNGITITDNSNIPILFDHSYVGSMYISDTRSSIKYVDGKRFYVKHIKFAFRFLSDDDTNISFHSSVF